MAQETAKQVQERLAQSLRTKIGTQDVDTLMMLLHSLLESAKQNLVSADISEFQKLQGEAMTYNKLVKLLERKPLSEEI